MTTRPASLIILGMLVVVGVILVGVLCLGGVALIDYRQSKQSVRRGARVPSSGSRLHEARRSARSSRARAALLQVTRADTMGQSRVMSVR